MANTGRFKIDPETGELVDAAIVDAKRFSKQCRARSDLPIPMIIHDNVEVQSQADGLWYSSKSALRKSYKHHGVVEIGDQQASPVAVKPKGKTKAERRKEIRDTVRTAASQLGFDTL